MERALEDQERHLLVKVIDRVLYKLDSPRPTICPHDPGRHRAPSGLPLWPVVLFNNTGKSHTTSRLDDS